MNHVSMSDILYFSLPDPDDDSKVYIIDVDVIRPQVYTFAQSPVIHIPDPNPPHSPNPPSLQNRNLVSLVIEDLQQVIPNFPHSHIISDGGFPNTHHKPKPTPPSLPPIKAEPLNAENLQPKVPAAAITRVGKPTVSESATASWGSSHRLRHHGSSPPSDALMDS